MEHVWVKQVRVGQGRVEQVRVRWSSAMHHRIEQVKADQGRVERIKIEQGRAEHSRVEQGKLVQVRAGWDSSGQAIVKLNGVPLSTLESMYGEAALRSSPQPVTTIAEVLQKGSQAAQNVLHTGQVPRH